MGKRFPVTALGETDAILDGYDKYTDAWLASVPTHVLKKIRLSLGAA